MERKGFFQRAVSFISAHKIAAVLILTNVIFIILFYIFIFGGSIYMYSDVGSDSLSSSFPVIALLSRHLHNLDFSSYSLEFGLGNDITASFLQYLNPLKFLMILFSGNTLPYGILFVIWLEDNLLSAFGYGFFRRLLKGGEEALFPTLAWTFTGYTVIWGQNYSFLTCILLFTAVMYFLQGFLDKKGRPFPGSLLLTLTLALFLISNFYFFYMTGFFAAGYTLVYLLLKKEKIRDIFKKELTLLFMAVLSVGAAGISLISILSSFLGSSRVTNSSISLKETLHPFNHFELYSMLSRFFSNDLLGTGNSYTGSLNYYEGAFLFVSTLFFFGIVYLVAVRRSRIPTLILAVLCTAALALPFTGRILNYEPKSHRWTFMICFLETIAIGLFIRSLIRSYNRRALIFSLVFTPVCIGSGYFLLYHGLKYFDYDISTSAVIIGLSFAAAFLILLAVSALKGHLTHILYTLLLAVLMAECIFANYPGINNRSYLTQEDWDTDFYNDGTKDAVSATESKDPGLYRISTGTEYNSANEGMADGFNSVSVYSNMNQSSLRNLTTMFNTPQISNNFFLIGYENYALFTLLSGKYLITDADTPYAQGIENALYEDAGSVKGKTVLQNKNALPFGYLYRKELSRSSFNALTAVQRIHAAAQGFFYTDGNPVSGTESVSGNYPEASERDTDGVLLLNKQIYFLNDVKAAVQGDGVVLTSTGPDPYIFIDIPETDENKARFLELTLDSAQSPGNKNIVLYSLTEDYQTFGDDLYRQFDLNASDSTDCILLSDRLIHLRMDIPNDGNPVVFSRFALVTTDSLSSDFEPLKDTAVSDIFFSRSIYRASVDAGKEAGMFCVPFVYQKGWSAVVNGTSVPVYNINGGLLGIPLNEGVSNIVLSYRTPHLLAGAVLTGVFIVLILILYRRQLPFKRRRHDI